MRGPMVRTHQASIFFLEKNSRLEEAKVLASVWVRSEPQYRGEPAPELTGQLAARRRGDPVRHPASWVSFLFQYSGVWRSKWSILQDANRREPELIKPQILI